MARVSFRSAVALVLTFAVRASWGQINDAEAKTVTEEQSANKPASTAPSGKNPVLPPKWAFGVLYGSYHDQAKILDAAKRLRAEYCGDLLWIDSSWLSNEYTDRGQNHYINFTFDEKQFPDAKGMIKTLRDDHFHFGVWQWPFIEQSITELYSHGEKNHFFITDQKGGGGKVVNGGGWHGVKFSGQIDFTNPAAAAWYKELNKPLTDMGLDFIKIDTYSTVPKGGATADGSGSEALRMLYHKAAYEVTQPSADKRGFYLAHRVATPNNDQYPGMWTGDTTTSWPGFVDDMKRGSEMNTPNTAAYWCSDTGGYNRDVEGDELYIRWLQYGTFLPVTEFFSSKGAKTRFPWVFGADGQRNFKFYTQLRYRLLPFRYSNAIICSSEKPVRYPVRFVSGRQDEIIVGNGDSEILVAPIHEQGATRGDAHLPAGKAWINYWTGERYAGGSTPTVDAPLDRVPMFIKAGSIIPMGPAMRYVDEKPADTLTVDIYPDGKSAYTLCEDDGISFEYQKGRIGKTAMACDATSGVNVTIGAMAGDFTGKLAARTYVLRINGQANLPATVTRDGKAITKSADQTTLESASEGYVYESGTKLLLVKFSTPTDKGVVIEAK